MRAPRLAQRLTAAFTLAPFLIAQPTALFTQALRPSDPQSRRPTSRDEIPLVPWPRSLDLLRVIDGARRSTPRLEADPVPATWMGRPALSHHDAVRLFERVAERLVGIETLLNDLHALSREATDAPPDALPELTARLHEKVARIAVLARLDWNGIHPLHGENLFYVFSVDRIGAPEPFLELDALRSPTLFPLQDLSLDTPQAITLARHETRFALEQARGWRFETAMTLERLQLEAEPTRGLREMEALLRELQTVARMTADQELSSSTRIPLELHQAVLEARLAYVPTRTDLPEPNSVLPDGLDGGHVWLEPRDPSAPAILFEVPDHVPDVFVSAAALNVDDLSGVAATLARIDQALEQVLADRERVLVAAVRLQGAP